MHRSREPPSSRTVLWQNRAALRQGGVLVPGERPFDLNRAAKAVRRDVSDGPAGQVWRRVVRQVREWPGIAVLSNEWLSLAGREEAAAALAEFSPAEVHVVFTARSAVYQVPAAWQETLKLGLSQPLGAFIAGLDRPRQRWSWWTLDAAEVLDRWGSTLPSAQVHVVTVPPPGSEPQLLWQRFAGLCGIEPDSCDTQGAIANRSMGAASARLLQELGPQLRDAVDADSAHWAVAYRWLRRFVAHELLAPLGGSGIALRADELHRLRTHAEHSCAALRVAGYDVVGDLAELDPPGGDSGVHPDDVTDAQQLAVAGALIEALLRRVRDESLRADTAEQRMSEQSGATTS